MNTEAEYQAEIRRWERRDKTSQLAWGAATTVILVWWLFVDAETFARSIIFSYSSEWLMAEALGLFGLSSIFTWLTFIAERKRVWCFTVMIASICLVTAIRLAIIQGHMEVIRVLPQVCDAIAISEVKT